MPILDKVTTKEARSVWKSPDGQREIFELQLEYEGKPFKASTYSEAIATIGWSGSVETYEKEGKYGPQAFVKQPPKEAGSYQSPSTGGRSATTSGGKFQADPFTMYLSYAKDLAIASVHEGKFDGTLYTELLSAVEAGGAQLYAGRPGGEGVASEDKKPEAVSMDELNAALGDVKPERGETPWSSR